MEQQAVEVRMGQTHLGFVDAAKGLGMLAIIWGHMDYLWSTSSVWFSSFKIAVFYVVVGLLKAYRYGERGQRDSCAQVMKKTLVFPGDPLWRVFGSGDSGAPGFSHHTRRQQTGGPEGGRDPDGDAAGVLPPCGFCLRC